MLEEGRRVQLRELIGVLDEDADGAYYRVLAAPTIQDSFADPYLQFEGNWTMGRNYSDSRRASGHSLQLKVGNDSKNQTWAYETIYAHLLSSGLSQLRARE
jgi:hypothetical protein